MSNNETESEPRTNPGREEILNSFPLGILEIDPAGKILYSNPTFHDMTGEDQSLIGSSILDLFDADAERISVSEFLVAMTQDEPSSMPVHFITKQTKNGHLIDLQINWSCQRDDNDQMVALVAVFTDVTENTQARLSKVMADANRAERIVKLGTYEWDWEVSRLIACSEEYARIHEMTVDEALAFFNCDAADFSYIHPDDRKDIAAIEAEALSRDKGYTAEYRMLLPSGRICHIREICEANLSDDGKVTSTTGSLQDVTEFKLTQEKLTKTLADARRAEHLVKLGTYEWDREADRLAACSEEYARICEMSVEEALRVFSSTEADAEYIHPDDRELIAAIEAEAGTGGRDYTVQYRMLLPSGRICHIREVFNRTANSDGKLIRTVGSLQDVTDQVLLEDQLRQAQKMEAVGRLAGGIAHEFNNLLMVISGYNDLLLQEIEPGGSRHHQLSQIKIASDRATVLTNQILAFGRKQLLQPKIINLAKIASEMSNLLQHLLGDHVQLQIQTVPDLKQVRADPGQIEQVIMNLLINAGDALPEGGNIIVNLENVTLGEDRSRLMDLPAGDYVMLSVSDNGIGMSEETISHVFEPFFTTKDVGKGNGLGLATVFGIIKQSGGDIEVESKPGVGSTFRIYLPQSEMSDTGTDVEATINAANGWSETILLVEDDGLIRKMLEHGLETLGYKVLVARNGIEAVRVAEHHKGVIDLMLTDVVMPGMGGHELASRLSVTRPEMSVLYMSGYDEETMADYGAVKNRFLQKPFVTDAVANMIREILDDS